MSQTASLINKSSLKTRNTTKSNKILMRRMFIFLEYARKGTSFLKFLFKLITVKIKLSEANTYIEITGKIHFGNFPY